MKINQVKQVEVEARTIKIHAKCADRFSCTIHDQDGVEIFEQEEGYVPSFMPGQHYGDYIILEIELDTGKILNWKPPTELQLEEFITDGES